MTVEIDNGFAWISQLGGPIVEWASPTASHRHNVAGVGLEGWHAHEFGEQGRPIYLDKHIKEPQGLRMLRLSPRYGAKSVDDPDPASWSSTLLVGEGRYVRSEGDAPDFPAALVAVEAHVHESRQIGGLTWWCESEQRWVAWLGDFELSARALDDRWLFESRGYAPNFEEAALLAVMTGRGER